MTSAVDPKMIEHSLVLKVMRLTRPTLNTDINLDNSNDIALSQSFVLPQSFGNIYLGETFSSYVSLHNDSIDEDCQRVSLRCDLQTASQRIALLNASNASADFAPGSSLDHVLSHEVKELGAHILVCEVSYAKKSAPAQRLNFRKFFKFQVMKPLDVKTKFYNAESEEVLLEAQVQNVTSGPMCLERVTLEPSGHFIVDDNDNDFNVFGPVNVLQPSDSRQYLFRLSPKAELKGNFKALKAVTNIGKLDIVWRTNFGDRGRLQTSQLQRLAPNHGDLRLVVEELPGVVQLDEAFAVKAKVVNNCDRTLELALNLTDVDESSTWTGTTCKKLGLLEPAGVMTLELESVPRELGLRPLSGVRLVDSLLMRNYDFDDFAHVFVASNRDELVKAS